MNGVEFVFDDHPWEEELTALTRDNTVEAIQLLRLLELEDEQTVQDALALLEQRRITLNVSNLPPVMLTGSSAMRLRQEEQLAGTQSLTDGLEPNDPLVLYLQELAATPAAGDPQFVAQQYLEGEPVAEQLVTLCLSRVVELAGEDLPKCFILAVPQKRSRRPLKRARRRVILSHLSTAALGGRAAVSLI